MSISRTAEALHLTPPAISIQVKQLAESAGQPLFEQMGKKIYLTAAGKATAKACRDVLQRIDDLSHELNSMEKLEKGMLSIGIITTSKYFVPRLIGHYGAKHPSIEFSLFVGNRKSVLNRIYENKDDIYVLGRPPENLKVTAIPFAPNPLIAVANAQHPLAKKRNIHPSELEKEPFILREEGSGVRMATETFFRDHQVSLNIRMELGSNEAIKQTVLGRLGIAFMAESTVEFELRSGELVKLDIQGLPLQRQWYVVYPENKILSPVAKNFLDYMISEFGYYSSTPQTQALPFNES